MATGQQSDGRSGEKRRCDDHHLSPACNRIHLPQFESRDGDKKTCRVKAPGLSADEPNRFGVPNRKPACLAGIPRDMRSDSAA